MKPCSKCKQNKQLSEFHKNRSKNDGLQSFCKICIYEYQKTYNKTERGKAAKRRAGVSEKGIATRKRYARSDKAKANRKVYTKKYRETHPERYRAIGAVAYAIKKGELIPAKYFLCYEEGCFNQAEEYHHYKGYAKKHWLDVDPMCVKCHRKLTRYHCN